MPNPIRILIVEKQQLVADALEALLRMQPSMLVVGKFRSLAESTAQARDLKPDIVILHFQFNEGIAIEQGRSEAKVIFLTDDESDRVLLAAIEAGVSAVVYLSAASNEVIDAIRTVAAGASLIPPQTIAKLLHNRRWNDSIRDALTTREMDVLRLVSGGISNRDIASRLGISYTTVRTHVRNVSGKLAAHSKLELVVKARQLDLVARESPRTLAVA